MVTSEEVVAAYRLILGREPESEEIVRFQAARYSSLRELRHAFIYSHEFLTSRHIDGPLYVACVPARYSQNQHIYWERGGLVREEDATGFLSRGVAGDL